jgi:hypothetical protein
MSEGILVLGCHRSGTSAVTLSLEILGVDLGVGLAGDPSGPAAASPPTLRNARGFGERGDALRVNERALAALGSSWDDPRVLPVDWEALPALDPIRAEAEAILRTVFGGSIWALKDPRLCRLQSLWHDAAVSAGHRLRTIVVYRNPAEVAASMADRNGFSLAKGYRIWALHLCEALVGALPYGAVSIVSYPQLLADPVGALERVGRQLGIDWPRNPEESRDDLEELLDERLKHQRAPEITGNIARISEVFDSYRKLEWIVVAATKGVELDEATLHALHDGFHTDLSVLASLLDEHHAQLRRRVAGRNRTVGSDTR